MSKEIDRCTILNRRNYLRMKHEAMKHNVPFVCSKCRRQFNVGDKIYRFRNSFSYYCEQCYKIARIDVPDDILDDEDIFFIEYGNLECLEEVKQ